MCWPALVAAIGGAGAAGAGAAAATGAAATGAAVTAGSALQTIGLIASVGGSLYQGIAGAKAAKAEAQAIADRKVTEAQLTATKDARTRAQYTRALRQQAAELAGRGIDLSSPTAVMLGQSAAQELSFASQAVRSDGQARQIELSADEKIAKGRAFTSLLSGVTNAATSFLSAAPDIWPDWGKKGTA